MTHINYANKTTLGHKLTELQAILLLSYLNQGKYFILDNCRWVVFRGDNFNKHTINKVPASDQSVKTMATILHTGLQNLTDTGDK